MVDFAMDVYKNLYSDKDIPHSKAVTLWLNVLKAPVVIMAALETIKTALFDIK